MHKAVALVSLLVLGWSWTLQGHPVLPDPLYPTQENFDQEQMLGTWYDVAIATTCPDLELANKDVPINKLELKNGTAEGALMGNKTAIRNGVCMMVTDEYEATSTPGRYFHHIPKWSLNIDAYVVHVNYSEYSLMIMSIEKATGENCTSVKLYTRSKDVRPSLMVDFKTLVKEQGLSEDLIIIREDKGDCVPGEQVEKPSVAPEAQRRRRALLPLADGDMEGSGMDDTAPFNGSEACMAAPDSGPCLGLHQRYFYNSTSMSCELFKYGGCLGNQNNFENERDCLQRCRTEAVCRLPMSAQPCTGQPPIWAFDFNAGLCVSYKAGFCQGNGNKFYSKAECEEYCGVEKDEPELLKAN